jgi:phosphoglycerate dehydrogenase-like enzyme
VKSGHLYRAGLDVVKDEPVSEGNPLLTEPRIFVTPHMAGSTDLKLDGTVKYLGEVLATGLCVDNTRRIVYNSIVTFKLLEPRLAPGALVA